MTLCKAMTCWATRPCLPLPGKAWRGGISEDMSRAGPPSSHICGFCVSARAWLCPGPSPEGGRFTEKPQPRWAEAPWPGEEHLETPLGPGAEPGRKVPLTPLAGVRQRAPVSSVWERAAATSSHEIVSSVPLAGTVWLEWPQERSLRSLPAPPLLRSMGQTGVAPATTWASPSTCCSFVGLG